jgi:glycine cleavage system H protein
MTDFLETTVDKFIFKVATDRLYNSEGVWAQAEGHLVRIGLSDFLQQRSGDVAFAEVKPAGTQVLQGDEVAVIETIKVNIALSSPVSGFVLVVNPVMALAGEAIILVPFGYGWLALIEASSWDADQARLLEPAAYFAKMKLEADAEVKKS